jgi:hypothetical protein
MDKQMTITVKEFKEYLNTLPEDTIIECLEIVNGIDGDNYRFVRLDILKCCYFMAKNQNLKNDYNLLRIGMD